MASCFTFEANGKMVHFPCHPVLSSNQVEALAAESKPEMGLESESPDSILSLRLQEQLIYESLQQSELGLLNMECALYSFCNLYGDSSMNPVHFINALSKNDTCSKMRALYQLKNWQSKTEGIISQNCTQKTEQTASPSTLDPTGCSQKIANASDATRSTLSEVNSKKDNKSVASDTVHSFTTGSTRPSTASILDSSKNNTNSASQEFQSVPSIPYFSDVSVSNPSTNTPSDIPPSHIPSPVYDLSSTLNNTPVSPIGYDSTMHSTLPSQDSQTILNHAEEEEGLGVENSNMFMSSMVSRGPRIKRLKTNRQNTNIIGSRNRQASLHEYSHLMVGLERLAGVHYDKNNKMWLARIADGSSPRHRRFSVCKFGFLEARAQAISSRNMYLQSKSEACTSKFNKSPAFQSPATTDHYLSQSNQGVERSASNPSGIPSPNSVGPFSGSLETSGCHIPCDKSSQGLPSFNHRYPVRRRKQEISERLDGPAYLNDRHADNFHSENGGQISSPTNHGSVGWVASKSLDTPCLCTDGPVNVQDKSFCSMFNPNVEVPENLLIYSQSSVFTPTYLNQVWLQELQNTKPDTYKSSYPPSPSIPSQASLQTEGQEGGEVNKTDPDDLFLNSISQFLNENRIKVSRLDSQQMLANLQLGKLANGQEAKTAEQLHEELTHGSQYSHLSSTSLQHVLSQPEIKFFD